MSDSDMLQYSEKLCNFNASINSHFGEVKLKSAGMRRGAEMKKRAIWDGFRTLFTEKPGRPISAGY